MNDSEECNMQVADRAVTEEQLVQITAALADVALRPLNTLNMEAMAGLAREVLRMTAPPAPLSVLPR